VARRLLYPIGKRDVERTRVLLTAATSRLLSDILDDVIEAEPDMQVVRHSGSQDSIVAAARRIKAHVVIVGEAPRRLAQLFDRLLEEQPQTRVLSLQGNGRQAFLYRLSPELLELGELSPQTLIGAIRDRGGGGRG
jgi:DNA-binding NarL/FixJ family response regulator